MAHAVVEWTSNLEGEADIHGLLELIAAAMRNSGGVFPWGGIRVRAIRLDDYVIADGKAMVQDRPETITADPEARRVYLGERFSL